MIGMVPLPGAVWRIFAELQPSDPLAKAGHDAATALPGSSTVSEAVLDRVRALLQERSATPRRASRPANGYRCFAFTGVLPRSIDGDA
jgi:hypothetical protein